MTTITTVEALRDLDPGTVVTGPRNVTWTRVEGGFTRRDGGTTNVTAPVEWFESAIGAGQVSLTASGQAALATFRRGTYNGRSGFLVPTSLGVDAPYTANDSLMIFDDEGAPGAWTLGGHHSSESVRRWLDSVPGLPPVAGDKQCYYLNADLVTLEPQRPVGRRATFSGHSGQVFSPEQITAAGGNSSGMHLFVYDSGNEGWEAERNTGAQRMVDAAGLPVTSRCWWGHASDFRYPEDSVTEAPAVDVEALQRRLEAAERERDSARARTGRLMSNLDMVQTSLHELMADDEDLVEILNPVLDAANLDTYQTRGDLDVTVEIEGIIDMDYSEIERTIHDGRHFDVDSSDAEIEFTGSVQVTLSDQPSNVCCDDLGHEVREAVEQWMIDNSVTYSSFSIDTTSCENC